MKRLRQGGAFSAAKVLLCAILTLALTACSGGGGNISSDMPGGGKWVDSDVIGKVNAEDNIRLQDDFAAAVNQDWIINGYPNEPEGGNEFYIGQKIFEAVADESMTGANADVLHTAYELTMDWDERNRLGFEPLRKYLEKVESLSSIEDVTAFQASVEDNPFALGLLMPSNVEAQIQYPDRNTLKLSVPAYSLRGKSAYLDFSSSSLEAKQKNDETINTVLSALGYSDTEIKRILQENYDLESAIAKIDNSNGADDNIYSKSETFEHMYTTREGLSGYAKYYPIFEILDGRGFSECNNLYLDYMYLAALPNIYNEKHLSEIKSYFTVQLINKTKYMFDRESFEKFLMLEDSKASKEPAEIPADEFLLSSQLTLCGYGPLVDEIYLEKYFPDDEATAFYEEMTNDLIDSYRIMLSEEDWISGESRAIALEKLENMVIHVIKPNNTADYSDVSIKGYDEGGNLIDAAAEGRKEILRHMNEKAKSDTYDRTFWDIYDSDGSTTQDNSYYKPSENAIYILAGWIAGTEFTFGEDATYEQILGYVGTVVGHEISHGFDSQGSHFDKIGCLYDEKGNEMDWMSVEDRSRLNERADKLASYFSLCRPIPGKTQVAGDKIKDEAIADMAGIKAVLYHAGNVNDFNYDEFFRAYAALWRIQRSEEYEFAMMASDVHPLNVYRININLQQFDEFLETYDIKPGDGMYLEPERRISVW